MIRSTFSAVLLLLSTTVAMAADRPVHLFILSGQSNMAGMNPEAGLLPEAKTLLPDADIAFIKVAKGGEPIRRWVDEWRDIATKHGYKPEDGGKPYYPQIIQQMNGLLEKHPRPASITFCWMQGERDAKEKLDKAYTDALNQLISNLRRDLKFPEMNVVIGRISDFGGADDASWQAVREAQVEVAKSDKRGAWVDCDDLNDKTKGGKPVNDLHYTKEGYELLGRRFARQARKLIVGEQPSADGRP
jgi:hypothetical protein